MTVFDDAAEDMLAAAGLERVYRFGKVPEKPTFPYLVVAVQGDRATAYTNDASHGVRFHRIILQSFGKTHDSAGDYDQTATDALLDQRPTVPGYDCGPCALEVGSALQSDPDDGGVIGITTTLTFPATKETP